MDFSPMASRGTIKQCVYCGKDFQAYNSLNKFCSVGCGIAYEKKHRKWNWKSVDKIMGKKNHSYKDGNRTNGSKRTWIGNKEFWRNRDKIIDRMMEGKGYVYCEHCGRSNQPLEGHHIIYRSEKPFHDHMHQEANILILCKKCHSKFHDVKSVRNEIVEQRKLHKLFGEDVLCK